MINGYAAPSVDANTMLWIPSATESLQFTSEETLEQTAELLVKTASFSVDVRPMLNV